jgi:hypothetical protein
MDSAAREAMAGAPRIYLAKVRIPEAAISGKMTFMDLMASCACSILSISINFVVWGSKSWSMISILESPEVRIEVNPAIMKRFGRGR